MDKVEIEIEGVISRLYSPKLLIEKLSDDNSTSPGLCIFIHGGGFVLGDLDCYDDNCRRLCYLSGHKIFSIGCVIFVIIFV